MLKVKVRTESVRLTIPVPYVILNIGISIISWQLTTRLINKWVQESMKEKEQTFTMPPLNKKELKSIVNELKKHKGLLLVDVKDKDGTEVVIKL
ncbi:hypothetical protein [Sporosarcina sp. YIM B06819]|uniref:hypothetical protein n=1 Tax=Sporosarcina sp. YIM B06819 TaxID=3081769 RepID=UPI00298D1719|nr:hypothetical protein [Sporosarcina sp. YIM B06819]